MKTKKEIAIVDVIEFNSGRLYSAEGQIIVLIVLSDGRVYFNDITRGCSGVTLSMIDCNTHHTDLIEWFMTQYDAVNQTLPLYSVEDISQETKIKMLSLVTDRK